MSCSFQTRMTDSVHKERANTGRHVGPAPTNVALPFSLDDSNEFNLPFVFSFLSFPLSLIGFERLSEA